MKKKYKYIFVVLVYKNTDVLESFFQTMNLKDSHVIVVNSFYDTKSLNDCQAIAVANNADFIPIENKGFGYGNNIGSKYALSNYEFDFLILSNSDIEIQDISYLNKIDSTKPAVIAPYIHLKNGKIQNPNIPWNAKIIIPMLNFAYKHNYRKLLLIPHALTRISREMFRIGHWLFKKNEYKIYCCHGAFIIFTFSAVKILIPFFNDQMFLYNEELFLAEKCKMYNIPIYFCPHINVLHLEGASSSKNKDISFQYNKKSFKILYNWIKDKKNSSLKESLH